MHNPPRILIADDNADNREILATQLATQDYELLQAADGEEAVAAARNQLPDLILLDILMPKLNGLEVCRRLKGDASLPFMPIILITVKSDTKDVIVGLEAGAVEYLTKPIDQMAVVARVQSVLRIKKLHDQVLAQVAELIISSGDDNLLKSHRAAITVVSCDLRGFTAFAEIAEPEELMILLREYHATLGAVIHQFGGTVERFAGDGLLVLFNDPLP